MKVKITIECNEPKEVTQHLRALIPEINDVFNNATDNSKRLRVTDNNCYGTHTCNINLK